MHSFPSVLGELPKTLQKCAFPQNFHIKELGKISIFYAIICYGENGTFVFLPHSKNEVQINQILVKHTSQNKHNKYLM